MSKRTKKKTSTSSTSSSSATASSSKPTVAPAPASLPSGRRRVAAYKHGLQQFYLEQVKAADGVVATAVAKWFEAATTSCSLIQWEEMVRSRFGVDTDAARRGEARKSSAELLKGERAMERVKKLFENVRELFDAIAFALRVYCCSTGIDVRQCHRVLWCLSVLLHLVSLHSVNFLCVRHVYAYIMDRQTWTRTSLLCSPRCTS